MFLIITAAAVVIQFNPGWRGWLLCDWDAIAAGEWWRIWTGHLVHFGWPHFVADAGLFLILGRLLERQHPVISRLALFVMPVVILAAIRWLDPAMIRYDFPRRTGLAEELGRLVLAGRPRNLRWRGDSRDCLWAWSWRRHDSV